MNRHELLQKLLLVVRGVTGESALIFNENTPLGSIEEWDSLNHLHIVVGVEKVFGIRFTDPGRLQGIVKVGDLLNLIADLKGI